MTDMAAAMIAEARALLGVRFAHQGRHAQHGLDCLGLLMVVAEKVGLRLGGQCATALDRTDYGHRPDSVQLQARLAQWLLPRTGAPQPGDVVLLAVEDAPQHLALLSDYPQAGELGMIHAFAPARRVVEHRYDATWQAATRGVYAVPSSCLPQPGECI